LANLKTKTIFNAIFREKPAMMLVALRNSNTEMYASSLAKIIDGTYSYIVKVLMDMQKAGLVDFKKQGRLKIITLTKKGMEVAEKINAIKNTL
jgi:predicted transcriptional regulator